jgi:hypothetical protein
MRVTHQSQNSTLTETNPALSTGFISANLSTSSEGSKRGNTPILDNKTTSEQKSSKRQCLRASEKLERRSRLKEKLSGLLRKIGETDLAERMTICGQKFSVMSCGQHVISRRPKHSCNIRFCPICAPKRSLRIQARYLPLLNDFLRSGKRCTPVHLVLTQAHRKTETPKESRARLMQAFRKLQRRNFWLRHFYGGVYAFEVTVTPTGYHAHLHIIAFRRRFFDVSILRREWQEITGDSHILRLDRVTDIESGLREVVKYISKPLDVENFTPKNLRDMLTLRGARLFGAFGLFAKFCRSAASDIEKPESEEFYCEGDACPHCEKPLFEMVMTVRALIGFLREIEAVPRR